MILENVSLQIKVLRTTMKRMVLIQRVRIQFDEVPNNQDDGIFNHHANLPYVLVPVQDNQPHIEEENLEAINGDDLTAAEMEQIEIPAEEDFPEETLEDFLAIEKRIEAVRAQRRFNFVQGLIDDMSAEALKIQTKGIILEDVDYAYESRVLGIKGKDGSTDGLAHY